MMGRPSGPTSNEDPSDDLTSVVDWLGVTMSTLVFVADRNE